LSSKSASREIYDDLFEQIISGSMPGGHRLKEIEISSRFSVSRTPVRDALRLLEQDGLTKILPAQGAIVVSLTPDDIEDIYDIRMMLELLAIDIAGYGLRLQKLTELQRFIKECGNDIQRQVELDTELHQYIINAPGRRYLTAMYERTSRLMQRIRAIGFRNQEVLERATSEHMELLDALLLRDIESAKKIIRRHIQNSKISILSLQHKDSLSK